MKLAKKIGLWMDNSIANIIEFVLEPFQVTTIESGATTPEKSIVIGEKRLHNKEQQQHKEYYKKLSDVIARYDEVILFGPTNAKSELFNILKEDHRFDSIKIEVKQTDSMTSNQQLAFVRNYFS